MDEQPKATEEKKVKKNWLGQPKKDKKEEKEDQDERLAALSTLVRLGILIWSGGILTLAYVELPEALKIPKQDLDPTFIASVFTGVLATFGVQTSSKKNNGGSSGGGISKADLEKLIAAAAQTAPAQTIRIEQAPLTIGTQPPSVDDGAPPVVPPKKS